MNNLIKPIVGLLLLFHSLSNLYAADYYWVENRGNWSDLSHWATSSGGTIKHTSLPTRNDNVFIDDKSFLPSAIEEIIIDLANVYCNDFSATGGTFLELKGVNRSINIYGNCDIQRTNGTGAFDGALVFRSNNQGALTINLMDYHCNSIIFDSPDGDWSFTGKVLIDSLFAVTDGNIVLEEDLMIQPSFIEFSAKTQGAVTMNCHITMTGSELQFQNVVIPVVSIDLTNMEFQTPPAFPNAGFSIVTTNTRIEVITADNTARINNLVFFGADDPLGFNYVELDVQGNGLLSVGNGTIIPNAYIKGFVNFESLSLTANRSYFWESDKDYNIENLNAVGNCQATIRMFATEEGMEARFSNNGTGIIIGQFLDIRDIHISAGMFEVFNSQDFGNTDGWIFNEEDHFLGDDLLICIGDTVIIEPFPNTFGNSYLWSNGSTESTYSASDQGEIWVDVTLNTGCVISDTMQIETTNELPLDLGNDTTLCAMDSLVLDITMPGATYTWQDGSTLPSFNITSQGTYIATVEVGTCMNSDTIVVDINSFPIVDLGLDRTLCVGDTVTLVAPEEEAVLEWQDGSDDLTYPIFESGDYYLTASNGSCISSDTVTFTFNELPEIDLGPDQNLCQGDSVTFDIQQLNTTFLWNDGSMDDLRTVKTVGTYWVEASINQCSNRDTIELKNAMPEEVDLGNDTTLCSSDMLIYDFSNLTTDVIWDNGSTQAIREIESSGIYWLETQADGCPYRDSVSVAFILSPDVNLGMDTFVCSDDSVVLSYALIDDEIIKWNDGSSGINKSVYEPGEYWLEVSNDGCVDSDTIIVDFKVTPTYLLGNDTTLCNAATLVFDFSSVVHEILWDDGSTAGLREINEEGVYWLEAQSDGCSSRDSIIVSYGEIPIVDLGADTSTCTGDEIVLSYSVMDDETIQWKDGSSEMNMTVFESGEYWIEVSDQGCVVRDTILVNINSTPVFSLGPDTLICERETINLQPNIIGDLYEWQDGSDDPIFIATEPGIYTLQLTVDGCSAITDVMVTTEPCILYNAYLPSVFSPNQDGNNDTFGPQFDNQIQIQDFQMSIFDRWGGLLFQSSDLNNQWDGTYNNQPLASGSYVYVIEVDFIDYRGEGNKIEKGVVSILR